MLLRTEVMLQLVNHPMMIFCQMSDTLFCATLSESEKRLAV